MDIVGVYLEALGPDAHAAVDDACLDQSLATFCSRACSAVPAIEPALAEFVCRLANCSRDHAPPPVERSADLALAFAAGRGDPAALRAVDALLVASVERAVARIDASPAFADLVAQELRTHLFVGDRPRIADYSAHGALAGWLRSAAARIALNLRRGRAQGTHDTLSSELRAITTEPELELLRGRHRTDFEEALRLALARLPPRARAALCLTVRDGMTLEKLAALHSVSRATAKRLVAEARAFLQAETQRELCARLGLTASEFTSVARALHGEVDVSLIRLLETSPTD